jgi:hypothetical protein
VTRQVASHAHHARARPRLPVVSSLYYRRPRGRKEPSAPPGRREARRGELIRRRAAAATPTTPSRAGCAAPPARCVRSPSRFPPATDDARACRLPRVPADSLVRVAGSVALRFLRGGVLVGPPARATLLRGWWVGRVVDWRTGAPSWPRRFGETGAGRMVEAEERNSRLLTFESYLFLP